MIEPKKTGKHVQRTTSTKISQTWLASQTGLIDRWTMPAQPPAALGAAGRQVPEAGAEVGAAEHRVGGQPEHGQREAELRHHAFTGPSTSVSGGRRASRRSSQTTVAASAT